MRKRTTGRSRGGSSLTVQLERANRKLRNLKSAGKFNTYSSKELLGAFKSDPNVTIDRKSKSSIIKIRSERLNMAQVRYYRRTLEKFNKSKTSTTTGIAEVEEKARTSLKATLSDITDSDITDQDVEDFYSLFEDDDFAYFEEKLGPSLLYILINEAKDKGWSEDTFVTTLERYITSNVEETRIRARRLYKKFVLGMK